ncbi:MAG TPA: hypothetical protein VMR86_12105 [Myxococcota bacterium]|nr:hypothetical protein [Myxococcota bacterium]
MGELLGSVAFPLFVAVSLFLGVRLLMLASRTRRLPEFAIGLNFLLAGALGYSLLIAAESLRVLGPYAGLGSFAGVTAISIGAFTIALFSQRVFRPESRASRAGLAGLALWLLLGVAGSWPLHVRGESDGLGVWLGHWAPNVGMLVAYGWSSFEPSRYAALMRRRAQLGLGDPLVANRMLLWGVGTGAIAGVAGLHLAAQILGHYELPPSLLGLVSSLVLVTALTEWLAFFPPSAYRRRFAIAAR